MAFFSGDIDGNGGHDDLAKQIAYNGKEWTEKHWRMEDMEVCKFEFKLKSALCLLRVDTPAVADLKRCLSKRRCIPVILRMGESDR